MLSAVFNYMGYSDGRSLLKAIKRSSIYFGTVRAVVLVFKAIGYASPFIVVLALFIGFRDGHVLAFPTANLNDRGVIGDSYGVITSLCSALGFAGVLLTIWLQGRHGRYLEAHQRSLFKLEAVKRAYGKAKDLLDDDNGDRATWIIAGRLLEHVRELADGVTAREHWLDLEVTHLEYRPFFADVIDSKDGAFFYGHPGRGMPLDQVAAATSLPPPGMYEQQIPLIPLDEASIYSVWKAGQFPEEYEDPLEGRFTREDRRKMTATSGLKQYLLHKLRYISLQGTLHERMTFAAYEIEVERSKFGRGREQ